MITILQSLKSVNAYPIPEGVVSGIAGRRGLSLDIEATAELQQSQDYRLAMADVVQWVSFAPNVQQADLHYNLLYSDRVQLRKRANAIYEEFGDNAFIPEIKTQFGYKGTRL